MTPEEKILTYSILSLAGMFVPSLPNKAVETVVKTLGLIVSVVFYCLAISELKKIKKNVYYKLSIAFLIVTSSIYGLLILNIFFVTFFVTFLKEKKGISIEMQPLTPKPDLITETIEK